MSNADDVKAAVEALRGAAGGSLDRRVVDTLLNHIDGEAARTQAACDRRAEEVREACARFLAATMEQADDLERDDVDMLEAIRATPLTPTPLGDENKALRARVAELEVMGAAAAGIAREFDRRNEESKARVAGLERERDEAVAALRKAKRWAEANDDTLVLEQYVADMRDIEAVLAKYPEGR